MLRGGGSSGGGSGGSMADVLASSLAKERAEAVALLDATMAGIVGANYTLIDPGLGTPTTWGRWDAHDLNEERGYSDERGLNSAQILAWLRAAGAWVPSPAPAEQQQYAKKSKGKNEAEAAASSGGTDGDYDYDAEANALKTDHGYGLNAVNAKITTPGDVNFSDDELLIVRDEGSLVSVLKRVDAFPSAAGEPSFEADDSAPGAG